MMLKLVGLSLVMAIPGVIHLISPEKFLFILPEWLPFKIPGIILTGVLELILAAGLIYPRTRKISAITTAAYLGFLNFIHLYVAIYKIPMFGFDSNMVLWGRFFFQFVLIWWAMSVAKDATDSSVSLSAPGRVSPSQQI